MRRLVVFGAFVALVSPFGCRQVATYQGPPPVAVCYDNPVLVRASNHQYVWETVVDVVDDYFDTEREAPVRQIGETITEGRIDTFPRGASTILAPWNPDSAGAYEKTLSTFQSMRRRATIRVIPAEQGYLVDVAVYKELEDVVRSDHATAGAATFRYDNSLTRVVDPMGEQQITKGWIPKGRDRALEQRIVAQLIGRFTEPVCVPR